MVGAYAGSGRRRRTARHYDARAGEESHFVDGGRFDQSVFRAESRRQDDGPDVMKANRLVGVYTNDAGSGSSGTVMPCTVNCARRNWRRSAHGHRRTRPKHPGRPRTGRGCCPREPGGPTCSCPESAGCGNADRDRLPVHPRTTRTNGRSPYRAARAAPFTAARRRPGRTIVTIRTNPRCRGGAADQPAAKQILVRRGVSRPGTAPVPVARPRYPHRHRIRRPRTVRMRGFDRTRGRASAWPAVPDLGHRAYPLQRLTENTQSLAFLDGAAAPTLPRGRRPRQERG